MGTQGRHVSDAYVCNILHADPAGSSNTSLERKNLDNVNKVTNLG